MTVACVATVARELLHATAKKKKKKKDQKTWVDIFSKDIPVANRYMKRDWASLIIKEIKLKPQWYINLSHLSGWLLLKREEITSVGEDMEKMEPLYTVGGM